MFKRDFQRRLSDLETYLNDLDYFENEAKKGGSITEKLKSIPVMRAGSFIVGYNALEGSILHAINKIRLDIQGEQKFIGDINTYWRMEIIKRDVLDKLQNGVNFSSFVRELDTEFFSQSTKPVWAQRDSSLPFPGNVSKGKILEFCKQANVNLKVPKGSLGGLDIDTVWENRNRLAHGQLSFSDVGALYTVADLRGIFSRTSIFVKSFLGALETYRKKKGYLVI